MQEKNEFQKFYYHLQKYYTLWLLDLLYSTKTYQKRYQNYFIDKDSINTPKQLETKRQNLDRPSHFNLIAYI